jgi:hypothetical protein
VVTWTDAREHILHSDLPRVVTWTLAWRRSSAPCTVSSFSSPWSTLRLTLITSAACLRSPEHASHRCACDTRRRGTQVRLPETGVEPNYYRVSPYRTCSHYCRMCSLELVLNSWLSSMCMCMCVCVCLRRADQGAGAGASLGSSQVLCSSSRRRRMSGTRTQQRGKRMTGLLSHQLSR